MDPITIMEIFKGVFSLANELARNSISTKKFANAADIASSGLSLAIDLMRLGYNPTKEITKIRQIYHKKGSIEQKWIDDLDKKFPAKE